MVLNSPPSATTSRSFSFALNSPPTTQDSRMHPFARYVSPQASVNISTDSSPLLLSPDAEIDPNVRNFNLIINKITSSLTIGLSSHIIAFS